MSMLYSFMIATMLYSLIIMTMHHSLSIITMISSLIIVTMLHFLIIRTRLYFLIIINIIHSLIIMTMLYSLINRGGSRNFERGVHKILEPRITVFGLWPLFESSVVAPLWKFVLHSRAQPCIRPYGDTHRKTQYLLFWLKTKCLKCYTMYNNTLLNYYPACRSGLK